MVTQMYTIVLKSYVTLGGIFVTQASEFFRANFQQGFFEFRAELQYLNCHEIVLQKVVVILHCQIK